MSLGESYRVESFCHAPLQGVVRCMGDALGADHPLLEHQLHGVMASLQIVLLPCQGTPKFLFGRCCSGETADSFVFRQQHLFEATRRERRDVDTAGRSTAKKLSSKPFAYLKVIRSAV